MAASYSSFLTSSFYSPVFNTALFDGAFRIYFSQSYETTALKIYHLLQTEHKELWSIYKRWSENQRQNIFILIYPSKEDVGLAFKNQKQTPAFSIWDDGLVIGIENSETDDQHFNQLFQAIVEQLQLFMDSPQFHDFTA